MKNISLLLPAALLLTLAPLPHPVHAAAGGMLRVAAPNVNVRERPGIASPVILKLQKDTVVMERSRQGAWVFVEVPGNGSQGWIHATLLLPATEKPAPAGGKAPALTAKHDAASANGPHPEGPSRPAAAGSPVPAPPVTKVGVVDLQRIIDESLDGKKTKEHFAELAASTPAENLKKIEQQLVKQVIEKIETVIARYARKEGFTHVVDASKSGFLFADERFDITAPIIRLYDQESTAGDAGTEAPAGRETPPPADGVSR